MAQKDKKEMTHSDFSCITWIRISCSVCIDQSKWKTAEKSEWSKQQQKKWKYQTEKKCANEHKIYFRFMITDAMQQKCPFFPYFFFFAFFIEKFFSLAFCYSIRHAIPFILFISELTLAIFISCNAEMRWERNTNIEINTSSIHGINHSLF